LQRFAAARRSPHQLQLHVIAVFDGPPFDRRKRRRPLAHLLKGLGNIRFGEVHRGHFNFKSFVIPKFEFRQNFENRAELQRLALGKIQFLNLGLRNGRQFLLRDGLLDALRDERLQYFTFNIFGEAPADERYRGFAWPESRHARDARKFLCHALNLFRHFFRGNL
jgi:hypothetical protein